MNKIDDLFRGVRRVEIEIQLNDSQCGFDAQTIKDNMVLSGIPITSMRYLGKGRYLLEYNGDSQDA
jgi:hypothetical protein